MIRIVSIFFIFLCPILLTGQQHANYTQYTLNRFALNPAIAGIKPCTETQLNNRRQWVGFEGAPTNYTASIHSRINKDDKYPKNFHGFGFLVQNDSYGYNSELNLKIAYAYHLKVWTNYHLSVGIYAGIRTINQSYNSITIPDKTNDPAINQEVERSVVFPEISPGGFLYNRNMFVGLSLFQVYPTEIKDLGTDENRFAGHYFLTAGYRIRGKTLHYIPSALISFTPFIAPTVDLTLTIDYEQKISLGLGSKYLNSGYIVFTVRMLKYLTLGYSYEYALNSLNKIAPSTHEFSLSFATCSRNKRKTKFICPAYE